MSRTAPKAIVLGLLVAIAGLMAFPPPQTPPATAATSRPRRARPRSGRTPPSLRQAAAEADPSIAAVLAGTGAKVEAGPWAAPTGARRHNPRLSLGRGQGDRDQRGVAPAPHRRRTPEAPYESSTYRIRASKVTGLRLDVLADGTDTCRSGRSTARPVSRSRSRPGRRQQVPMVHGQSWVLAPVFRARRAAHGRPWRRSRAWNRRLPSMTRHDRSPSPAWSCCCSCPPGSPGSSSRAGTPPPDRRWAELHRRRPAGYAAAAADPAGPVCRWAHPRAQLRDPARLVGTARPSLRRRQRLLPRVGHHRRDHRSRPLVLHPARRARPQSIPRAFSAGVGWGRNAGPR